MNKHKINQNDTMITFSIITITKNDADGLIKTKQSIEYQTYKNYEWVLIDGNKEPDNGIYDAMNKGIERSKGEFLIFMNGGDEFASHTSLELISSYQADFMYGDSIENNRIKKSKHHLCLPKGMITHHQSMVYRREVVGRLRYDERYPIAADYKFTLNYLEKCRSFVKIDRALSVFAIGGISQKHAKQGRIEQMDIRRTMNLRNGLIPYRQFSGQIVKRIKMIWNTNYEQTRKNQ